MAWRNHENHKQETKAVKKALEEAGINARVGHGSGTAWAWLEINIGAGQDFPESERLAKLHKLRSKVLGIAQHVTCRHGDYEGNIIVLAQDHWTDKAGHIPISQNPNIV